MIIKLKKWEDLEKEFGLDKQFQKDINTKPRYTTYLEEMVPEDRIIEVSEKYFYRGYTIPKDVIEKIIKEGEKEHECSNED